MKQPVKKTNTKKTGNGVSLVRKSNNLIEARYNFDIWEMRLFLILISQIRRDDQDFGTYRIYYRDVANTFGLNLKRGYAEIRESAKNLLDRKFYVDTVVDGFHRQDIYHIIRKISVLKEGQEGKAGVENQEYIDVKIEEEMKPLLLQLQKSFTTYDFDNITNLGLYAIRIYELFKQYETIGHRTLEFEEMKRMFELEDKYPLFANFFAKIITPSVKEINKYTDLFVTKMERIKNGKKTVAIRFEFKVQKKLKNMLEEPKPEQIVIDFTQKTEPMEPVSVEDINNKRFSEFYPKIVESLGITPMVFIDLLKNYSDEQFNQAIRVTHRAKIEGQIKTNISGFFIQALKKGFTDQKEERIKKEKKEDLKKQREHQRTVLENERQEKIYERITKITMDNPSLTLKAIEIVKETENAKKIIEMEEKNLSRTLELEDFRQIRELRFLVIDTLLTENIAKFQDIFQKYDEMIRQLQSIDTF